MDLISLFFPKICLGCAKTGQYICPECLNKVALSGKTRSYGALKLVSLWRYEGVVKKAIIVFKYRFVSDIAQELAFLAVERLKELNLQVKNGLLVPIPLGRTRQNWRGFNQTHLVGKLVAQSLGWGFAPDLLLVKRPGTQVGLARKERLRNIRGKYAVNPNGFVPGNCTLIIFDDVWTTGATIKEAVRVLKRAGFKNIVGLALAR